MNENIPWTRFYDMHSGGGLKEDWSKIHIQAPEDEACIIFQNRFGHNPYRVTCTCCGSDYSVSSDIDLAQLTGYDRECDMDSNSYIEQRGKYYDGTPRPNYQTLEQYLYSPDALFIKAEDIKPEEREGELKRQGYIWMD